MFDIHQIWLDNFKSFRGKHTFRFPEETGLYFVTGKNEDSPRLGANGIGKSTLLDAIYWCLYGRTLRGLKANDVITWDEKTCTVSLTMQVGEIPFKVTRGQSPNYLSIDGVKVEQEAVNDLIRLTPEAFVYGVMLPQFGQSFFELKPADKLTLFSQIMGLDYWLERSEKAATTTKQFEDDIAAVSSAIATSKRRKDDTLIDLKTLERNAEMAEEAAKAAALAVKKEAAALSAQIKIILDNFNDADAWHKELLAEVEIKEDSIEQMKKVEKVYLDRSKALHTERTTLGARMEVAFEAKELLNKLKDVCPTCKQKVDKKHLNQERANLEKALEEHRVAFDAMTKKWDIAYRFYEKTMVSIEEANNALKAVNRDVSKALVKKQTANSELSYLKSRKKDIDGKVTVKENPYRAMIESKLTQHDKLTKEIATGTQKLNDLNAQHAAAIYWVAGFKRVRLFIIEETLKALEMEVNSSLTSLGLVDWQIEFDVERENKSGGVTKGFVVFVRSPDHPEPVRFESWSGGETQRLQLAGDLGLANLIMQQAGLVSTIEMLDEPSEHLSTEGVMDLVETLAQRAIHDDKRILLVDHRTIDFSGFTDTINIIKTEDGSAFEKRPALVKERA